MMSKEAKQPFDEIVKAVKNFGHVLPTQATLRDFVHHNTLHGFEHLRFQDALKVSHKLTGAYGYWPQEKFRACYLKGRITNKDISSVLVNDAALSINTKIDAGKTSFSCHDVYRIASLFPLKKISSYQLKWQFEEAHALERFQKDVPESARKRFLAASSQSNEKSAIKNLWAACIDVLDLNPALLHPETLMYINSEHAETIESKQSKIDAEVCKQSLKQLDAQLEKVGDELTLRGLLQSITGVDIQQEITPYLLPYLSNWLDEGFAQWHANPDSVKGFYQSWKASAVVDEVGIFSNIPDWKEHIDSLPNNSADTVATELRRMSIPENKWGLYITRLALDLPGWSGMFYWRHDNPDYRTPLEKYNDHQTSQQQVDMMDYLAVRLVLEHLYARKLCRQLWLIDANMAAIRGYLHLQYHEFFVRHALYENDLPEYLITHARQLVDEVAERETLSTHSEEWKLLAHMIWIGQQNPSADSSLAIKDNKDERDKKYSGALIHHDGWKLFRLAQHLGLCGEAISQLNDSQLDTIFNGINTMDKERSGFVLLRAYEHHYRESVFNVVTQNQGRGTWADRINHRPEAQIIFCMDDREEGYRRHLEAINPAIETLGAAAFFGVVMNWKGVNDDDSVVLCPVVVTPVHEVQEVADPEHEKQLQHYKSRVAKLTCLREFIHQDSHRSLLTTSLLTALTMPVTLATLLGKVFAPLRWNQLIVQLKEKFEPASITRVNTTISPNEVEFKKPTSESRQLGYSIEEQTDIVESFLQNNGLLTGLSALIVLMGHYSRNQNNPHAAAYGCGACGGKFSGPNGRVFASMANHPVVRIELAKKGLDIPSDTWFIGAEHDTCNEDIVFSDVDLIPERLQQPFNDLKIALKYACELSAHERCRKLASAPKAPTEKTASDHIAARAVDFSQARPELGHATIAMGFVGRRHLSQGIFMDRRCFLISYDASIDPEEIFLERILLSAGPVGAGINLEYYFSSVNNDKYGCGSKVVHNLSGLFGVMEGGSGDLRTGLPLQMVEIHEPMRLQLMVEASTEVLTKIYKRQPAIQQLVGNGWLLLSSKDPKSAEINTFDPDKGWELWVCSEEDVKTVKNSQDWYRDHYDHLSPVLLEQQRLQTAKRADCV